MRMVLDVHRQQLDSVKVNCGELSRAEFKRRCRNGYYMVPEGQTMHDKRRKERSDRLSKMFDEIANSFGK